MELPLFVGDGTDAALFSASSFWSFHDELHQPQEEISVAELKQSLVATTVELEAVKEELERKEQSIARLADLVRQVAHERDEARDQLLKQQQLLLLAATAPATAPPRVVASSSFTDSGDCSLVSSSPVVVVTSADKRKSSPAATPPTPPPPHPHPPPLAAARQQQQQPAADAVLDVLAGKRPLPRKGRLLAAVMESGPLLQNLLVAGQLPRWRDPAAALGHYGDNNAYNACLKRPASSALLPLTTTVSSNCSSGFLAKRVRLH